MSDNQIPPNQTEEKKDGFQEAVSSDPTVFKIERKPMDLLSAIVEFIRGIFTLKEGLISYSKVIKETKDGVSVKGYNVWILMCSIAIASVGLNVNSTAVIVGAMLISPLMGPIRGLGFSVGINDFTLLIRSIKNLGITVAVSLTISFLYFLISPLDTITEQLFIRTEPNFLDVVVAFFGGLAGVMAAVNSKNDTVIPGVAIATALMPPLCTAGYGLAVGNFSFFLGAMYLFIINSVLIALSTLIVVRYLNFPKREYVDPKIEKKVRNYIVVLMIIVVILPSGYLFYKMAVKTVFEANAYEYVEKVIKPDTEGKVSSTIVYHADSAYIDIVIQGDHIKGETIAHWMKKRKNFNLKDNVGINIYQGGDYKTFIDERLKDVLENNISSKELVEILMDKDAQIKILGEKIDHLKNENQDKSIVNMQDLINDFKIDYPQCHKISINRAYSNADAGLIDTTYTISIQFSPNASIDEQDEIKMKLSYKLKRKLKLRNYIKQDSIPVYTY